MKVVGKTALEIVILGIGSVALAITANAVRPSDSVKLLKNYFPPPVIPKDPIGEKEPKEPGRPIKNEITQDNGDSTSADEHSESPYRQMTFEQVKAVFNDPNTEMGVNLFIDARDNGSYEDGHIPGAIQADHYRIEEYLDRLLAYVEAAEKVIVYCNGGDCEDSMFLCTDLLEFDVCYDKIHLYPGGWQEWKAHKMPIETGCPREQD